MKGAESFQRVSYELREGRVSGLSWGDSSRTPDILFLHATGFNARTYRTLLEPLGERFHVLAIDLRGHGLNQLPKRLFGYGSWLKHRDDVIELIADHLRAPVTLVGHSLGATVALLAAGRRPDLARGVAMLDPVLRIRPMLDPLSFPWAPVMAGAFVPMIRGSRRRRNLFESREAAQEALTGRGVFRAFRPDQLADYLADGLEKTSAGFTLTCPPQYEARTFAAQRHNPWRAAARAPSPLICLKAEHNSTFGPSATARLLQLRPDTRIAVVEGGTHMFPMERPDRARAAIETAVMMANPNYRDLV